MSKKQDIQLGSLIHGKAERDAIHVAVAPVVAACEIQPGQHIGFIGAEVSPAASKLIGYADPQLTQPIKKGQEFWLCLYQNTIVDMRHHWKHPAFLDEDGNKGRAETRIKQIAQELNVDYDELISHAQHYLKWGDYWCEGGRFEGVYLPDDFWDNYEELFGVSLLEDNKHSFFSCSC